MTICPFFSSLLFLLSALSMINGDNFAITSAIGTAGIARRIRPAHRIIHQIGVGVQALAIGRELDDRIHTQEPAQVVVISSPVHMNSASCSPALRMAAQLLGLQFVKEPGFLYLLCDRSDQFSHQTSILLTECTNPLAMDVIASLR